MTLSGEQLAQLSRAADLRDAGVLSNAEFEAERSRIMDAAKQVVTPVVSEEVEARFDLENHYASQRTLQIAGFVVVAVIALGWFAFFGPSSGSLSRGELEASMQTEYGVKVDCVKKGGNQWACVANSSGASWDVTTSRDGAWAAQPS